MRPISPSCLRLTRAATLALRAAAVLMLAATPACGLKSSHKRGEQAVPVNSVHFRLASNALNLVEGDPSAVRFRVYAVDAETRGAQEGDDVVFPLASDASLQDFQLSHLALGTKDVEVDVVEEGGDTIGRGTARVQVGAGEQTFGDPLVLLGVAPADRRADFLLAVDVGFSDPTRQPLTTYVDVKPLFDTHCAACHGVLPNVSGLDLSSFPFHDTSGSDQAAIVRRVLARTRGTDQPARSIMPPSGALPSDRLALLDAWVAAGLPAAPTAGGDALDQLILGVRAFWRPEGSATWTPQDMQRAGSSLYFSTQLAASQVGTRYEAKFQALGPDGCVLGEDGPRSFVSALRGDFASAIGIAYHEPVVTIPVVIKPR